MAQWIPSVVGGLVALVTAFAEPIQVWISGHPVIAAVLAGVGVILAHLLPSPVATTKP